jgi:serine protease Do
MRKAAVVGLAVAALVVLAGVGAADLWAQARGRVMTRPDAMMFAGPGGELGVSVRDPRPEEIASAKLPQPGGVFIDDVRDGSPAARGGLREGDIIIEFDGERVRSARHFTRLVRETVPGRGVKSSVVRGGARQEIDVTLEESDQLTMTIPDVGPAIERGMRALPRDFAFDLPPFDLPGPGVRVFPRGRMGVTLAPLSDQLATYFGAKEGVLVSTVDADSPASRAGIRAGDVITSIAGRPVRDAGDVTRAVRDAQGGATIDVRVVRDKKELDVKITLPERAELRQGVLPV